MSNNSLSTACLQMFKRDCLMLVRRRMDLFNPLLFGFLVALMFPLGLGPSPKILAMLSPGLIWIIALLSCLLATDGLFQEDFEDGSLQLYNLESDISESTNLVESMPEKRNELLQDLRQWRTEVSAPVPKQRNPEYRGKGETEI